MLLVVNDFRERVARLTASALLAALEIEAEPAVEVPRDPGHGDFSTNIALSLAKSQKRKPREIAGEIVRNLPESNNLFAAEPTIDGPGFINYRISDSAWRKVIGKVIEQGDDYGRSDVGDNEKVMVEFVSANPTGPLHIGHARNAAVGDSLARLLDFSGHDVTCEFYVNDLGTQMEVFHKTIRAKWREAKGGFVDWEQEFPDGDYYPGDYVREIAEKIVESKERREKSGDNLKERSKLLDFSQALNLMIENIKRDLRDFDVQIKEWFCESKLHDSSEIYVETLNKLISNGDIYEKDGARWFKVSKYQPGEEDRVINKSSGERTYFASDVAYHFDKLKRGFGRLINVWGADHHGYIGRVKAALQALGFPPDHLQVLLVQMVNLVRDGEQVRMGKRTGEFITLREVLDEVGSDAMRFMFLTRSSNAHLDFDIDALKMKPGEDSEVKVSQLKEKNPVYYVQYAHARTHAIFRKASERGIDPECYREADLDRLVHPEEIELARKMERFPREVASAALDAEPHRVSHYLLDLAGDFHRYYYKGDRDKDYRVLCEDRDTSAARMALAKAVATVIRNGLKLLGVKAPERM